MMTPEERQDRQRNAVLQGMRGGVMGCSGCLTAVILFIFAVIVYASIAH